MKARFPTTKDVYTELVVTLVLSLCWIKIMVFWSHASTTVLEMLLSVGVCVYMMYAMIQRQFQRIVNTIALIEVERRLV
jgi:hypothetical protein